jgi:hypothetical protein
LKTREAACYLRGSAQHLRRAEPFMSGHNRWTKIEHKKAAQGATRGRFFTKLIEIPDALLERFVQG